MEKYTDNTNSSITQFWINILHQSNIAERRRESWLYVSRETNANFNLVMECINPDDRFLENIFHVVMWSMSKVVDILMVQEKWLWF